MQIIDNFLPQDFANQVLQELNSANFPWYLNQYTSYEGDNEPQLVHNFYNDQPLSAWYLNIHPMLEVFENKTEYKINSIGRIKANLLTNRVIPKEYVEKTIHQDTTKDNYVSLLYYVDDADGDTILYKEDKKTELMRVTPKRNRAVIFKSNIWHTGLLPIKTNKRRVINFILEIK
jgi:hypothetical protein